jgi:dolichol-phosphate mannosyltransferase
MRKQPDVSIIIPFLNEESNMPRLGEELIAFTEQNRNTIFEIILVNDGSTDGSRQAIYNHPFPEGTKLVNLSQNYGSHAALRAGITKASGKYITFLYSDLQDPIDNVTRMYEKIRSGEKNITWAFRKETRNALAEKWFSRIYASLMKKYVNPKYPPNGFDVVMFDHKVAKELNNNIESNSSIFLQILNLGFESDCIHYTKQERVAGKSKWTLSKKIKLLIDSFVGFSFAPIRLVSIIGIAFFITGCIWSSYIIFRKLVFDDLASGWPALLSVLMLGFGITNISLGIIAEYLWRTLDSSRRRPVFIIDDVVQL